MRHRQIEAFRSVMIAGSITEASRILHVSQPSVSRLIADLEHAVGFSLFERKHGRIYPTSEAVEFFEEVERSFLGLDRLTRYARKIADFRETHLTISGMPALSMDLVPMIVSRLMQRYPSARITIEARSSDRIVDWVAMQRCDVGFVARPYDVPGVACCLEMTMSCVLILRHDHPLAERERISFADLRGEKIITLTNPLIKARLREELARVGVEDIDHIDTTLSSVALKLVELGLGVGLIEPLSAHALRRDLVAVRPLSDAIPFEFGMVAPERRASSKLVTEIRDISVECLDELTAAYGVDISYRRPAPIA